ncbi:hypothetical protein UPYG_G00302990 [Umbra pygmaea]|uniref:Nucleoside-diphosphate kinase n=1 Tax=Umbra pygmaea TaxID=75934 RepID=A0ABD0W6P8_UMBPY
MGEPSAVFLLDCSPDTMSMRLQYRALSRSAPQSSAALPTDKDHATYRRVEGFARDCQPVAAHYQGKRLLHKIDAEKSPEEVFSQICRVLDSS